MRRKAPYPREIRSVKESQLHDSLPRSLAAPETTEYVRLAVGTSLAEAEKVLIYATLELCHGNKTRAASMLGVSLKTLYNRINEYRTSAG
jgi:DNA-binding NtrC family response regulator